jgi:hypothetical protein
MRVLLLLLGWGLCFTLSLRGQVSVEVVMDEVDFLPGESVIVGARIINLSGQTLHLGKDNSWLAFTLTARDGFVVPTLGEVPVAGEFDLESSSTGTKRVDLAPYFQLTIPGRYRVTATVRIPEWDREITSKVFAFNVIKGAKLWEQEFGVPNSTGAPGAPPEVRKFALQQAQHQNRMRLYVRLTDAAETRVIRVFPVGPMVSFSRPEHQFDRLSNLHLLFQTGARAFNYSVVDPDGQVITRQTHMYSESRPTLQYDKDGNILVSGGMRQFAQSDLPVVSSGTQSKTNDVKSAAP